MSTVVEHDGTQTEFADDTLFVFIDDTGHESLSDPDVPYFGLGGCLSPAGRFAANIDQPWCAVEDAFPAEMRPLHAARLRLVAADFVAHTAGATARFWQQRGLHRTRRDFRDVFNPKNPDTSEFLRVTRVRSGSPRHEDQSFRIIL